MGHATSPRRLGLLALLGAAGLLGLAVAVRSPPTALFAASSGRGTEVIGSDFPKRLIDPSGQALQLAGPPRRIASATLASDEMLAELVAPERVVAVTHLVDDAGISNVAGRYPAPVRRIRARIEEMLALEPDLVIVATYTEAATVALLLHSGVAVARLSAVAGFAGIAANIRMLGAILGSDDRAARLVATIRHRLDSVQRRIAGQPRPRVLFYSLDGSTGGPGSLTDEMIQLAGGFNTVRDTGITGDRRISAELAIALQPEVLVLSDWSGGARQEAERLRHDPAWQRVPAIRDGRIHALPGAWVTAGSQFRIAGVEALARLLHPEAFADAAD